MRIVWVSWKRASNFPGELMYIYIYTYFYLHIYIYIIIYHIEQLIAGCKEARATKHSN